MALKRQTNLRGGSSKRQQPHRPQVAAMVHHHRPDLPGFWLTYGNAPHGAPAFEAHPATVTGVTQNRLICLSGSLGKVARLLETADSRQGWAG